MLRSKLISTLFGVFCLAWAGLWAGAIHAGDKAAAPLKVGLTASLSGQYQALGSAQLRGAQMWMADVNGRNGLLGRPIELVYYDDQSDAEKSAALYQRLIDKDRVELLLGPYSSELTIAASDVANQHGLPMVAMSASAAEIWSRGNPNIFGIDLPAADYLDQLVRYAQERGFKRIAVLRADTEFAAEVADGVHTQAKDMGLQVVLDEEYRQETTNFSALMNKLRHAKADVILGASYLKDSVALVRAIRAARLKPKVLAFTVGPGLPAFGEELGVKAEGVMGVVQWIHTGHIPYAQDFAYRFLRKYGEPAGPHAVFGYAAGQVMEAAVRLAQSTKGPAVRTELQTMSFRSLLGLYKVDQTGKQIAKKNFVLQWQDGKRRLVLPAGITKTKIEDFDTE